MNIPSLQKPAGIFSLVLLVLLTLPLIAIGGSGEEANVVIAKTNEGYEPLHALYRRKTCLPAIEAAIDADQWKVIAWFPQVKVRVLTNEELKQLDPAGLAFWNVNTPEEFAKAEQISLA